ncbi:MAG: hypothetical protein HY645_07985 [Acidobacteria bacterium]|nr:hypothetical protein [Acidobacteriota bacterium]
MLPYRRSEAKEFFREKFAGGGLETVLLPSYKAETLELDEEGIRSDIRRISRIPGIRGFAMACLSHDLEEMREIMRIAGDEAGKVGLVASVFINEPLAGPQIDAGEPLSSTFCNTTVRMIKEWENLGGHWFFFGYPFNFRPKTENEVYEFTKKLADQVDMAFNLYITRHYNWETPGGTVSPQTVARMAEIPTAAAIKHSPFDMAHNTLTFKLCGKRILVSEPFESWWLPCIANLGMTCVIGNPVCHQWQNEEIHPLTNYVRAAVKGDLEKAWEIYWGLQPLRDLWWSVHAQTFAMGIYPMAHWKYWDGLVGMTGGPLRMPYPMVRSDVKVLSKALWGQYGLLRGDPDYQDAVVR